jgi:GNAT superfamily N-acetyltransferase
MHHTSTMSQANRLLQATLEIPREFLRGHEHTRSAAAATAAEPALTALDAAIVAEEKAAKPEPHLVPIRSLASRHRRAIKQHLLELSDQDRYLRFGYTATDEQVTHYIDAIDFNRDEVYGVFNRRLKLIALAHLAIAGAGQCESCAEFGVSVSADARGKGLGTILFRRAVLHARSEGVDMLFIHALSENTAMLKIARNSGAVVESYGGEVEAHLRLPAEDFADRVETAIKDAVADTVGMVDFRLKLRALQFWAILASVQEIRQGVRGARAQAGE